MPRAKGLGRHRKEKALASKLDQLRVMTTVVSDTGDVGAVACLKPADCTRLKWTMSQHRSRGPTTSSTPTNREASGSSAFSSRRAVETIQGLLLN